MFKRIFLALVLASGIMALPAQEIFSRGTGSLNLGVGLGSFAGLGLYGGTGYSLGLPPISLSYDHCIVDNLIKDNGSIGVGGYVSYGSNKYTVSDWGWRYHHAILGARGTFHYQFVDKLDTYAGVMLGYHMLRSSSFGNIGSGVSPAAGGFSHSAFAGARYYFSPRLAAFAEIGYGLSMLEAGLAFKL